MNNNQILLPISDRRGHAQVAEPINGNPFLSLPLRRHQLTHATCYAIWAIVSLVLGGVAMVFTEGQWHHFVHMNAAWGSINLLIATWCLYQAKQISPTLSARVTARKERKFRQFIGVNLGLDLLYLVAGQWLYQLAVGSVTKSALLLGFGQAVGLQGLALLILDTSSMLVSIRRHNPPETTLGAATDKPPASAQCRTAT